MEIAESLEEPLLPQQDAPSPHDRRLGEWLGHLDDEIFALREAAQHIAALLNASGSLDAESLSHAQNALSVKLGAVAHSARCGEQLAATALQNNGLPPLIDEKLRIEARHLGAQPFLAKASTRDPRLAPLFAPFGEISDAAVLFQQLGECIDDPAREDWPPHLRALRRQIEILASRSLEDELAALIFPIWGRHPTIGDTGRAMVARYLGWDGLGGATLEKAGDLGGVSRARVSQLTVSLEEEWQDCTLYAPALDRALRYVREVLPAPAAEVENQLALHGVALRPFRVEGLLQAARVLKRDCPWRIIKLPLGDAENQTARWVCAAQHAEMLPNFLNNARRLARKNGCVRLAELHDEADAASGEVTSGEAVTRAVNAALLRVLVAMPGFVWLDARESCFWFGPTADNRLVRAAQKLLAVAGQLETRRLHELLLRAAQNDAREVAPPHLEIFERISAVLPGARLENGVLHATDLPPLGELCGSFEQTLIAILREHGPVLSRQRLQQFSAARGLNLSTLDVQIATSILVERPARGWVALLGTDVDLSALDGANQESAAAARERWAENAQSVWQNGGQTEEPGQNAPPATGDDLFAGIDAQSGEALEKAVAALLARARHHDLLPKDGGNALSKARWSLAEVQASPADYLWLQEWMRHARPQQVRHWLRGDNLQRQAAIGLVLLLFCCETARREARGDALWPVLARWPMRADTRAVLWANNQPSRVFKDALEAAAQTFHLRHVFGVTGLQNWFDSIRLQFGFSLPGLRARLGDWLAGAGWPHAVETLLEGPQKSASFVEMWENLRLFRRNHISEERLRAALRDNPWVLCEWHDELLESLRVLRDTERAASAPLAGDKLPSRAESEAPASFVKGPFLEWDSALPHWRFEIAALDDFDLPGAHYQIVERGQIVADLWRRADGGFDGPEQFYLPLAPQNQLLLRDAADNTVAHSVLLEGWQSDEDVAAFSLPDGRAFEAWRRPLETRRDFALLTAADLRVEPAPDDSLPLPGGRLVLHRLPAGRDATPRVWLEDEVLWPPADGNQAARAQTPSAGVFAFFEPGAAIRPGQSAPLLLRHNAATRVLYLRQDGGPVDFENGETLTHARPNIPESGPHPWKIVLRAGLVVTQADDSQTRRTVRLEIALPQGGAFHFSGGVWKPLSNGILQTRTASAVRFLIHPPATDAPESWRDWALMEGDSFVRRLSPVAAPLKDLSGWGEPLTLRRGPYNALEADLPISSAVIDQGLLKKASFESEGDARRIEIYLAHPIEPDAAHRLLWWDGETVQALPVEADAEDKALWRAPFPQNTTRLLALALSYEGARLGALWNDKWSRVLLAGKQNAAQARETAALLRWFKLPLLDAAHLPSVRDWAARFPGAFLEVWLREAAPISLKNLPFCLVPGEENDMARVIAAVFAEWKPNPAEAAAVAALLAPDAPSPAEALGQSLADLRRAAPALMASVAAAWLQEPPEALSFSQRCALLDEWKNALGAAPGDENSQLAECALAMRCDEFFVRGVLDNAVRVWQGQPHATACGARNLALAVSLQPFRLLLARRLLREIALQLDAAQRKAERAAWR